MNIEDVYEGLQFTEPKEGERVYTITNIDRKQGTCDISWPMSPISTATGEGQLLETIMAKFDNHDFSVVTPI